MLNFDRIYISEEICFIDFNNFYYFTNCLKINRVTFYIPKYLDVVALKVLPTIIILMTQTIKLKIPYSKNDTNRD